METYQALQIEIVAFEAEDVITTRGGYSEGDDIQLPVAP